MNIYVFDTCAFTEMRRTYPKQMFSNVWEFVGQLIDEGKIISSDEVLHELGQYEDEIHKWCKAREAIFAKSDREIQKLVSQIVGNYEEILDFKKVKSGADPFVIACAIRYQAILVTQEKPVDKNSKKLKIPDVCKKMSIQFTDFLGFLQKENFSMVGSDKG